MARFKVGGRGSTSPRLKRRFQILVFCVVVFMVTMSVYILQPEFFSSSSSDSSASFLGSHVGQAAQPGGHESHAKVPLSRAVEELVVQYRVNFENTLDAGKSPWTLAASWVTADQIVPEPAHDLGAILHAMSTAPILAVDNGFRGTQLKLSMKLAGGQIVAFKPKWYERDYIVEGKPYAGRDRHNAEVAAFHLSRIMGFRRTPLAVGRTVSLSRDIVPYASKPLLETFHDEDGDTCFYGQCHYCNKENSLCTTGDLLEGTIILWLPSSVKLKSYRNPWRRTYREKMLAKWETDEGYCSIVRQLDPYKNDSALLLDLIDVSVFDYLVGNADRHHFETTFDGKSRGMLVMLDNGKSFGNPYQEERSILAPLYQCCSIRWNTWRRLLSLQNSVLSSVLREVLTFDPLTPVLSDPHLQSLDRRLDKVLAEVDKCITVNGHRNVIVEERVDNSNKDEYR